MGFYFINHRVFITLLVSLASITNLSRGQNPGTSVGFYSQTCHGVETTVRSIVTAYFELNATIAPGLVRMFFHDCFVDGCDGSILINGSNAEKTAIPNQLLRGYEVIQDAKNQLERMCPGIVSCADILALAARDSVVLTGGRWWDVPTGRRDGLVSLASNTINLPSPIDTVDAQIKKFQAKGLNITDLVVLTGAHTIGTTACKFIKNRLYNYSGTGQPDPSIKLTFLRTLQSVCHLNGDGDHRVGLDNGSEDVFDRSFFANLKAGQGVLESDQRLWADASTRAVVNKYLGLLNLLFGPSFGKDFGVSMVKMGNIEVKTGKQGEIRKICSRVN